MSRGSELAPGRHRLSIFFSGAEIAAAGPREWKFEGQAQCEGNPSHPMFVADTVALDAARYEAETSGLSLSGSELVGNERHGLWSANLSAHGPGKTRIGLGRVPKEFHARLENISEWQQTSWATLKLEVVPGAAPGRYYIGIDVMSGGATMTREIALDVSPEDVAPRK